MWFRAHIAVFVGVVVCSCAGLNKQQRANKHFIVVVEDGLSVWEGGEEERDN